MTHYDVIFVRTYPNVHCKYRRTLYFSHQSPKMYLFLRIKRRLPTFHHVVIIIGLKWSSPANYCAYCGLVWCLVYCQGNRIKWQDQTKVDRQWRVPYGVNPLFKINKQSVKFARQNCKLYQRILLSAPAEFVLLRWKCTWDSKGKHANIDQEEYTRAACVDLGHRTWTIKKKTADAWK